MLLGVIFGLLSMVFVGIIDLLTGGQWLLLWVLCAFLVWGVVYTQADKLVLHFLRAREVMEADFPILYQLATNQAYKLKMTAPRIYLYSGFFPRGFALRTGKRVGILLEKNVIESMPSEQLATLIFGLVLEARMKGSKSRTRALAIQAMVLTLVNWLFAPLRWFKKGARTASFLSIYFGRALTHWTWQLGAKRYGKVFKENLSHYPSENLSLERILSRWHNLERFHETSERAIYDIIASAHPFHQVIILALESCPRPYDSLTSPTGV